MRPDRPTAAPVRAAGHEPLLRCRRFRWDTVPIERYKAPALGGEWVGISRQVLIAGSRGAPIAFDVRYFEIEAGGCSSLEAHEHAHVVIGLRGEGRIRVGRRWLRLRQFDVCTIGPNETHQLRNADVEPFGFLCLVDAERDASRAVDGKDLRASTRPRGRNRVRRSSRPRSVG